MTTKAKFKPGRGYSKTEWDDVSDNPELTRQQIKKGKPFAEAFPDLAASIKRSRGRPRVASPKAAVTLRVDPITIEQFKAKGKDWRARMAKVLELAKAK